VRKLLVLALVLVAGVFALAQENVALVNGEPITREELNRATDLTRVVFTIYQQFPRFAQTLLTTEEGAAFLKRYELDILEQLILRVLELQEARARGIEPAQETVDAKVQETLDQILQQNNLTEEQLVDILARQGRTLEDFREDIAAQVREQLAINALRDEITAAASVTEDEIQTYYAEHPDQFMGDDGELEPLAEVHDQIAALILDQHRTELWKDWLADVRAKAQVEINLEAQAGSE